MMKHNKIFLFFSFFNITSRPFCFRVFHHRNTLHHLHEPLSETLPKHRLCIRHSPPAGWTAGALVDVRMLCFPPPSITQQVSVWKQKQIFGGSITRSGRQLASPSRSEPQTFRSGLWTGTGDRPTLTTCYGAFFAACLLSSSGKGLPVFSTSALSAYVQLIYNHTVSLYVINLICICLCVNVCV